MSVLDRDENTPQTSLTQGNATLINVSENGYNILDRNLGNEVTEPSQISNEIELISQRLAEGNISKTTRVRNFSSPAYWTTVWRRSHGRHKCRPNGLINLII